MPAGKLDLFSFADVADLVTPAVVTVLSQKKLSADDSGLLHRFFPRQEPRVRSHGSGFVLDQSGTVVTNNPVVEEADQLTVRLMDGREYDATVIGRDEATDIAMLRIPADGLPAVQLGNSDAVRVGEWVLAIGSPFRESLGSTVTTGIISGKGRDDVDLTEYEGFLQTDAAVNPGNSGGPLVNLQGQVIGINTAIATQNGSYQGVSFAIPINLARVILERLLHEGRVTRAWLGVVIVPVTTEVARRNGLPRPQGVRVSEVHTDSPADHAGLLERDIIVAMDGEPTEKVSAFRNRISLFRPGQRVRLDLLREGKSRTFHPVLAELTQDLRAELQRPRSTDGSTPEDLGIEAQDTSPQLAARFRIEPDLDGAVVVSVRPGSKAEAAGLRAGDVIRFVNRRAVDSVADLEDAILRLQPDRALVLRIARGSQSLQVTLVQPS